MSPVFASLTMPLLSLYPSPFSEILWEPRGARGRSTELSPLYAARYSGPHEASLPTAHPYWELLFVMDGEGRLETRDQFIPLVSQSVCLIPPQLPHREKTCGTLDLIWIGLRGTRLDACGESAPVAVRSGELCTFAEDLWLLAGGQAGKTGPELDGRSAALLGRFWRLRDEGGGGTESGLAERALRYLGEHFRQPLNVEDLASHFSCSAGHLQRAFRRQSGQSLIRYAARLRAEHAAQLLWRTN
ncbi:MAG: helix-turn-helix transcriptional regulator, partial [Planctomycetes bacterium]|nr:helix-turn-helix transcriptional regulator [Planctomycetota bacterium]